MKPWHMGTHLRVPMNNNMTWFKWFFKNRCVLVLWVILALALEGLIRITITAILKGDCWHRTIRRCMSLHLEIWSLKLLQVLRFHTSHVPIFLMSWIFSISFHQTNGVSFLLQLRGGYNFTLQGLYSISAKHHHNCSNDTCAGSWLLIVSQIRLFHISQKKISFTAVFRKHRKQQKKSLFCFLWNGKTLEFFLKSAGFIFWKMVEILF